MTDEQQDTPQPVERISLTDIYQALPDYLDTAEPYDVEAGWAKLDAWIDTQTGAPQSSLEPVTVAELDGPVVEGGHDRSLEIAHALTPELARRWLDLEERRIAVEEARADAETAALQHRLDEETLEAAHRRELQAADAEHLRVLELRKIPDPELELRVRQETWMASRQLRARVLAVVVPSITWLAGFVVSVLSHLDTLGLVLGFGLFGLGSAYGSAVLLAARSATTSDDPHRRSDAARILRFLMFREAPLSGSLRDEEAEPLSSSRGKRRRR